MSPTEIAVFGITLFLALVVLIEWKRRRKLIARRLNDGLRGYVSGKPLAASGREHSEDQDLGPIGITA
jgi:hypothetical protein